MDVKMSCMNALLPLPNPGDWLSPGQACKILGVSHYTLNRMAADQRLTAYRIGPNITLYWRAQVETLRDARKIAGRVVTTPRPEGEHR